MNIVDSKMKIGKLRLGIYCDSGVNGGHEEMLKRLILALAEWSELESLHLLVPDGNAALFAFVKDVAGRHRRVSAVDLPFTAESITGNVTALLRMTRSTAVTLQRLKLSKLLIAQGTIASGLTGLLAARLVGTKTVSYLPLVDDPLEPAGGMTAGRLKWFVKRLLYRLPHEYITLNEHLCGRLRTLAPNARSSILENYVDDRFSRSTLSQEAARAALALPRVGKMIIAHIGRINFQQKRHNFLLDSIESHPEVFRNAIVLIVGEGRDAAELKLIVKRSPVLSSCVWIVGPQSDVLPYIVASDVLVLPSAYEGVPLVMIEAVLAGRPIVVSNVSGLDSYLPTDLLFPADSQAAFVARIVAASTYPVASLTDSFRRRFSRERFDTQVRNALLPAKAVGVGTGPVEQNKPDWAGK